MSGTSPLPIDDLLRASCQAGGTDGAGVSVLASGGSLAPLYATDDVATGIERLQFALGEGPCVESCGSGGLVLVPDLTDPGDAAAAAWPVFCGEATKLGARAVFAFPMTIGSTRLGAVDFYRGIPGAMSIAEVKATLSSVEAVGQAVLDGPDPYVGYDAESEATSIVHQAAGMAMVQLDTSIDEAMLRLRGRAFAEGCSLAELAADIVHGRRRMSEGKR